MMRITIFLFGLLVLTSCNSKEEIPAGILNPEKMQAVLWDVIRADVFTADFIKKDTLKDPTEENLKLQQEIFAIHKITSSDFYSSYDYYKTKTSVFKVMLDSMVFQSERNKNLNIKPILAD